MLGELGRKGERFVPRSQKLPLDIENGQNERSECEREEERKREKRGRTKDRKKGGRKAARTRERHDRQLICTYIRHPRGNSVPIIDALMYYVSLYRLRRSYLDDPTWSSGCALARARARIYRRAGKLLGRKRTVIRAWSDEKARIRFPRTYYIRKSFLNLSLRFSPRGGIRKRSYWRSFSCSNKWNRCIANSRAPRYTLLVEMFCTRRVSLCVGNYRNN